VTSKPRPAVLHAGTLPIVIEVQRVRSDESGESVVVLVRTGKAKPGGTRTKTSRRPKEL
jgi:hypothetical protein